MNARRRRRLLIYLVVIAVLFAAGVVRRQFAGRRPETLIRGAFLVAPYLQWGSDSAGRNLEVLWQTQDVEAHWSLEVRPQGVENWRTAEPPVAQRYQAGPVQPRLLFRAKLTGLAPGEEFTYRVLKAGRSLFEATSRAPKGAGQPHRFVAFGDGGADSWEQRAVTYQAFQAKPDYVFIAGDLVYYKGLMSEYLEKFFPVYNADQASPEAGSPLLRSTLVLAAPGNHDLLERRLDDYPDGLAYFLVWSLPRNGPLTKVGAENSPTLIGSRARQQPFLDVAGEAYPQMANYSFDVGDVHWTVLDTNPYANWSDPALRGWLERDLASAKEAPWRIVAFHQPPFHSSKAHYDEQRTRLLAPVFEQYGVDLVISGHIHNYQRTYPLRFAPEPGKSGQAVDPNGQVQGRWRLDKVFDGKSRTKPDGVLYIVTGGGGARLYDSDQTNNPSFWQQYTARFISDRHSLTVVDVETGKLTVKQVSESGEELDRFVITK